ncbi:zinc ribbon domain-containing protein [Methanocrinis sp.]|uniref:zinc ribbon domain-containing protein n=1 Tax=Methanocrinis sp. TaxID=3101522 RepID=UPI003D0E896D
MGDRKGKEFSCPSCGWSGDADFNGARNIADLGAVVNQPGGPGLFCLTMAEKIPGLQKAPLFRGGSLHISRTYVVEQKTSSMKHQTV